MVATRGSLVGNSYKTREGNTLTPVEYFALNQKGKYILECNVCSKDMELFPYGSIITSNDSVRCKKVVCGCGNRYRWSEDQYLVRIGRRCDKEGYMFNGFLGDYSGYSTKLDLFNPATGNRWWTTCIQTFLLLNTEDPVAAKLRTSKSCILPEDYFIGKFLKTGKFKEGTVFTKVHKNMWSYTCPVCSVDDFVKNGVCDGVFNSTQGHLSEGKLGCRCVPNFKSTPEQLEYQIKKSIDYIGGSFTSWVGDNRSKRHGRFSWECGVGHPNESPIQYFLKTKNCKTCFANGYKNHLPAKLYLVKWESEDTFYSCLKYGITNLTVRSRVVNQKRMSDLTPTVLYTFHHEDGKVVEACEKEIKARIGGSFCSRELLPRGFSETVDNTEENITNILEIIKGYGLINSKVIPFNK